ncbi:FAD-dependent thymidylate synthase [Neorickettsia findlayensis]|uniref:Flavin-dependent thymidylate synthase n=1 Tax=Neorickettsia findlayensis TaxID=2686014 RepID=A0A6P1G920_9RICK|nr:FAD-dependent thymidylate synthase [Neorickettsia findlayensis]QHD64969.1 FAD-dependent thymidylate synthase [Neorickettsia findlayensis]
MDSENLNKTKRVVSESLEGKLGESYQVLDKGFVRVVDYMGNDQAIVQAARVSYGKGTKTVNQDRGLIHYLMRHGHTTPFEMCEIKFHVKMPIFVARQWIRHRTANVNEYSARYSIVEEEFYIPEIDKICYQSTTNSQGRGDELEQQLAQEFRDFLTKSDKSTYDEYTRFIEKGLAREIARIAMPLNTYTEMYWKVDLHNLFHFLKLRSHQRAQYEIRKYAEIMEEIVSSWVPMAYEAFLEYEKHAKTLSRSAIEYVRDNLKEELSSERERYGIGAREFTEVTEMLTGAEKE